MSHLIRIMLIVPPNTRWIERGYSTLEMIWQKRCNKLGIYTMASLFFLAVLQLKVKDSFSYEGERKCLQKK